MTNLAAIVLVCAALPAVAATSIPPKPPTVKKAVVKKVAAPTQGSGAMLLTAKAAAIPVVYVTNRFFFAATATFTNLESDFSTEVSTTNIIKRGSAFAATVTLAWDYPYTNFPGSTFKVYRGMASSNYTASFPAGTNHQLAVPLYGPFYTNCVITVSCPPGGTNLQSAKILNGPWTTLNKTNWQGTNVTGKLFFRSMGNKSAATISRRWQ